MKKYFLVPLIHLVFANSLAFADQAEFFNHICGVVQEFSIQTLYENEIKNKIIKDNTQFCQKFLTEPHLLESEPEAISEEFKHDQFGRALFEILKINEARESKASDADYGMMTLMQHLPSLLIGITVTKVWDKLSVEDRINLRTDMVCENSSTYGKLPKFSDLATDPGPGNPMIVSEILNLCQKSGDLREMMKILPRALLLEAFMVLDGSGLDIKPYVQVYCSTALEQYSLFQNSLLEQLGRSFEKEGYLHDLDAMRASFGLNARLMRENEFSDITYHNLSQEDLDALFAWKGSSYIWMSNREEFGIAGDIFSLFHQKGGLDRRPGQIRKNLRNLKSLLERLPAHRGLVYRGVKSENPEKEYKVGEDFSFDRYSSTSTNLMTAVSFSQTGDASRSSVILVLLTNSGRNIIGEGPNRNEREVLFTPGSNFRVVHTMENSLGHIVYAVENE